MTTLDWILSVTFIMLYFVMIFTVCFLTFQKGHWLLGIIGIFVPFLWLIGAIMPAKRGSRYEVQQAMREQAQIAEMTN
ncbi:MAG TPA: hypothetical protein VH591_20690 [Ktedonobacterales bacterium]|jgi:hypothetical protein